jgi:predicted MarR family transcription regulator
MIIDFDLITVTGAADHVTLTCTLCGGRLTTRTDQVRPITLGKLVESMSDHLASNHGPANSS